jgi:hypothetical protein
MESNYYLALSSLSFIIPAIVSYKTSNYDVSALCAMVSLVSSSYHITKNPHLLYIDYPLNQITHVITFYRIFPGGWMSIPAYSVWLSYIMFVYYYGYLTTSLIWNPDLNAATPWHMTLHVSTALTTSYTIYASVK